MILEFAAMNEFQLAWFIVFFLEAVMFFWLFEPIMQISGRWKGKAGAHAVFWVLIYLVAKWQLEGYIFLNILSMLILGTIGILIFTDRSFINALWLAAVFTICVELGRVLTYGPIYITGNHDFYLKYVWELRLVGHLLKTLFAFCCRKTICEYSRFRISGINWSLIILAIVQLIFMHYRRMISAQNTGNIRIEMETFVILGVGVLSQLTIVIYNIRTFLQKKELETIRRAMKENYREIQVNSEVDTEIRRIYHDLKQQVAAINFSEKKEAQKEKQKLTEKLSSQVADLERVSGTGSILLDSLLNHKLMEARNKNVRLELFVDTLSYDFIDSMDLCSIVGNAIDNACEAAAQISTAELRWVQVKSAIVQGIWVFKVENTCEKLPVMEHDAFISSKPGPKREGIGIRSIQYCARKYNGKVEIQTVDNHFILRVMVPIIA